MIRVEPYRPEHLRDLVLQDAQSYLGPVLAEPGMADRLAHGESYTVMAGEGNDVRPIACVGVIDQWKGRCIAWALLASDAGKWMLGLTRIIARMLLTRAGRVETSVKSDFEAGHRWAQLLGFVREGRMRRWHEGEDYDLYARVT